MEIVIYDNNWITTCICADVSSDDSSLACLSSDRSSCLCFELSCKCSFSFALYIYTMLYIIKTFFEFKQKNVNMINFISSIYWVGQFGLQGAWAWVGAWWRKYFKGRFFCLPFRQGGATCHDTVCPRSLVHFNKESLYKEKTLRHTVAYNSYEY